MTFSLQNALVYDLEDGPNYFTFHLDALNWSDPRVYEISFRRDDRAPLMELFNWCNHGQIPMIAFNSLHYDYNLIHAIMRNPSITFEELYRISKTILNAGPEGRFNQVWANERFAPQIDLFKLNHFDNKAKTTNLKALEINMRMQNVRESGIQFDTNLTAAELDGKLIPYGNHDVKATKQFAWHCMKAIEFRIGLMDQFGVDVLNYNDSKIGSKLLEYRLGENVCYKRDGRRKIPRQTPRARIALKDVIFPYIKFNNPEFQRVHEWLLEQVLTPEDIEDPDAQVQTKGVFSQIKAHVGGIEFHFGTGGIHASVPPQHVTSNARTMIRDIDVASLYPSIAIVNRLYPEHLGQAFIEEYAKLPEERKEWQAKKGKKCVEANSMKLAGNGTYGNSNNKYSAFYDPQMTMTITINGQLMLCMLAELLITVPTAQLIQANTDGITYRVDREYLPACQAIEKQWQEFTMLKLEDAEYSDMWIRDVNNYIARPVAPAGANAVELKQKGAYWHPKPGEEYADSISESQPPAWHKDLGNLVSIKAAIAYMVDGIDPEQYIRFHSDPFDFMCRIKVNRSDTLLLGNREMQRNTRYYVGMIGESMTKISPPIKGAQVGDFKRASKVSDQEYARVTKEIGPGVWDARIHTKNQSRYEMRDTKIEAGWKICECNDAADFRFDNVNVCWYLAKARKLIISGNPHQV